MTPNVYQQLSSRTICPQEKALERIVQGGPEVIQLLHSVIGMMGELGEICSLLQKVYWYGKQMSHEELLKQLNLEYGDSLWYHAEGLSAIKSKLQDVMQQNIGKLQVRYPDRYSDYHAAEENRNRTMEESVIQDGHGFGHKEECDNQNPNDGPTDHKSGPD